MGTNMYPSSTLLGNDKDANIASIPVEELIEKADGFAGVFPGSYSFQFYFILSMSDTDTDTCQTPDTPSIEVSVLGQHDTDTCQTLDTTLI